MNCRCLIIEDQLPAQRILERYINDIPNLELVGSFTDPLAALDFIRKAQVDLLFLDIHLPKLSGMDFLKILPYQPRVILTTAFSEYALEGYEYSVVDYLLKPISFERFLKAVSKVLHPANGASEAPTVTPPPSSAAESSEPYLFVKSDRALLKLTLADIIYIKAEEDFSYVYTADNHHFLSYTLKFWEETLPAHQFCRIHRSYLVQLAHINRIEANQVFTSLATLPIGRSYREHFMQRIKSENN